MTCCGNTVSPANSAAYLFDSRNCTAFAHRPRTEAEKFGGTRRVDLKNGRPIEADKSEEFRNSPLGAQRCVMPQRASVVQVGTFGASFALATGILNLNNFKSLIRRCMPAGVSPVSRYALPSQSGAGGTSVTSRSCQLSSWAGHQRQIPPQSNKRGRSPGADNGTNDDSIWPGGLSSSSFPMTQ